jgi:pyridoxal phosphate enzyme (YggS family)
MPTLSEQPIEIIEIKYKEIMKALREVAPSSSDSSQEKRLIAVTKQQPDAVIRAILAQGHRLFGENRYQEAKTRWTPLKLIYPDIRLAYIGGLQSNKAAEVVAFFDDIHSLDRPKLAEALAKAMHTQQRPLPCYIQVNTGEEPQKSGIIPSEAANFTHYCRETLSLNIVGLMCIPPADQNPAPHFAFLRQLAEKLHLPRLSMGMSQDWPTALRLGATDIRVGSALFGERG